MEQQFQQDILLTTAQETQEIDGVYENLKKRVRKDSFGNQIIKGQSNHKISFESNGRLENKVFVQNWKNHNSFESQDKKILQDDNCKCIIY